MKVTIELTGVEEAKNKIQQFKLAAKANMATVVAGVVDGAGGHYSAYYNMMKNAQNIVYDVYDPVMYDRKGLSGGLAGAIKADWNGELEARVWIDGDALADEPLDNGKPYFWRVLKGNQSYAYDFPKIGAAFMQPRDFFTPTVESMQKSMKNGAFKKHLVRAINAAKTV